MARPPRPEERRRGEGRDRRGYSDRGTHGRRPGQPSGPIRRVATGGREPGRAAGEQLDRAMPRRTAPQRERSAAAGRGPGQTAHPERWLTTRTDTSSTVLGPNSYTPRRLGLLAAIAIVLLVTVSIPLRNHYQYLGALKAEQQKTALEQQRIGELEAEAKQLSDPAFIEQQARIRFGAVKPGESPYRISQVDPVEKAAAEQAAAELASQSWQTRLWRSVSVPPAPVDPVPAR